MTCTASTSGMTCVESANPRHAGRCYRCSRPLEPKPKPIRRDTRLESQIIENATRGLIDATSLIEHCQARALHLSGEYVSDPMTIRPRVDRKREIREELIDAVNHALFEMQAHPQEIGGELWHDMEIVIRGCSVLYDKLLED